MAIGSDAARYLCHRCAGDYPHFFYAAVERIGTTEKPKRASALKAAQSCR